MPGPAAQPANSVPPPFTRQKRWHLSQTSITDVLAPPAGSASHRQVYTDREGRSRDSGRRDRAGELTVGGGRLGMTTNPLGGVTGRGVSGSRGSELHQHSRPPEEELGSGTGTRTQGPRPGGPACAAGTSPPVRRARWAGGQAARTPEARSPADRTRAKADARVGRRGCAIPPRAAPGPRVREQPRAAGRAGRGGRGPWYSPRAGSRRAARADASSNAGGGWRGGGAPGL